MTRPATRSTGLHYEKWYIQDVRKFLSKRRAKLKLRVIWIVFPVIRLVNKAEGGNYNLLGCTGIVVFFINKNTDCTSCLTWVVTKCRWQFQWPQIKNALANESFVLFVLDITLIAGSRFYQSMYKVQTNALWYNWFVEAERMWLFITYYIISLW